MCSITDNMTAVAITFLIATITGTLLTNIHQPFSAALKAVLGVLPAYGLSLLIVGFYWMSHHRIYLVIRRHNMTLIWLNFAFLLFIELQPLLNALRASYPTSQLAAVLYASNQACTGLMLLAAWLYAARGHRLVDKSLEGPQVVSIATRALFPPLIFLLSIAVVFFHSDYAFYLWLLVIALEAAGLLYRRRRTRLVEEVKGDPDAASRQKDPC